ncbi:hypothetical protein R2360_16595 [Mycobacteroides chelonae]|uniref:Uncharacterized protein n=1 Tax=Mycobacteroides chelonae TaxID=1774 RepID=A0AB73U5J3_MYCCH|nr:hypothetical protein [Mycobacteroides chelonae]MEC4841065.1 hypothetical protein [Mycobacteroides chelonae]MEC4842804.1 hypothetical protein [Mycobacteroides chelonae]OLT73234.1 hypothetical protein BKG57_22380 [Mycobacteroides chelonae]QDF71784.1 hypothetical protein FJK96_17575 [Mycobacteroides chelonae]WED92132.1 hypothetical protein PXJ67_01005 [Mycobacteroides chelonae]
MQPDDQVASEAGLGSPLYRGIHLQHEWTTSVDEILSYDTDSLLSNIAQTADGMGGQLVRAMAEHISAICERTGNVVDAGGSNFYEAIIEVSEKMELAFDDEGKLKQQILLHPDNLPEEPPTAEQEARLKAVIDRKREEWSAARSRRELP